MKPRMLYRSTGDGDSLVFALAAEARRVHRINHAISTARTWKEFRSLMPRRDYSDVLAAIEDCDGQRPRGSDEFSGECVPGWCDGYYPTWLQQTMEHVVPASVLMAHGTRVLSMHNGPYWKLPLESEAVIVRALEALGWDVRRAEDLDFM